MAWRRTDKIQAEPVRNETPALPDRTSDKERYCTTCKVFYKPSQASSHIHDDDADE